MGWQDLVLGIGGIVLTIPLLGTLYSGGRAPTVFCLTYAAVLGLFGVVYLSLGQEFGAGVAFVQSVLWYALVVRNFR